ncbi:ACT domain-containing protein [Marinobacter fonticola]|uniref:ACT domain-containing protein n=1 Tax=Marinobacter fonticola TaxID=2603215 RepID=UPI0011E88B9F|nr:ACT domain-containing protein [Marinobacter fonticola]
MKTPSKTTRMHTLACRMSAEAAAIERLCQVTRIRGFRIEQMQVQTSDDGLEISMTLSGERSIDMLRSQLEKLHTVTHLRPAAEQGPLKQTA